MSPENSCYSRVFAKTGGLFDGDGRIKTIPFLVLSFVSMTFDFIRRAGLGVAPRVACRIASLVALLWIACSAGCADPEAARDQDKDKSILLTLDNHGGVSRGGVAVTLFTDGLYKENRLHWHCWGGADTTWRFHSGRQ